MCDVLGNHLSRHGSKLNYLSAPSSRELQSQPRLWPATDGRNGRRRGGTIGRRGDAVRIYRNRNSVRAALLAGCLGSAIVAAPAWAQASGEPDPAPAPGDTAETPAPANSIVVTGSRIARRDYTATSPIVTIDADLIEESSQINLEANLNKLPQFTPALTQFNTGDFQANANNTIGISTVSLRQLGSNRNLVLIDGRRGMPVSGTGVVDINSIPSAAVQRVEVITGGASSTYGADAVGGVVNFILRDDFTGFEVDAQGGISERGDGEEYRVATLVDRKSVV